VWFYADAEDSALGRSPLLPPQSSHQSLHLLSATSFILMYFLLFWDPAIAAMTGWMVSMTGRQIGHFFFEPKDYDTVNERLIPLSQVHQHIGVAGEI
jgi:hypothetical protein